MTGAGGEVRYTPLIRNNLDGLYTLDPYMTDASTNDEKIQRMKVMLKTAMEISLTDRQREVVQLFYFDNKKVNEIAIELKISRQSVHKLLSKSKKKLEKLKNIF